MIQKRVRTIDKNEMQRRNASLILDCLRSNPGLTRAELARHLGISRGTATNLVNKLMEIHLIHEVGSQASQGGRPGVELTLNPRGGAFVGVELKDSFVSIRLTDFLGNALWLDQQHFKNQAPDNVLTITETLIDAALQKASENDLFVLGIGLGLSGLVDTVNGVITLAPTLGWQQVRIYERLSERFSYPIYLANDAAAAAMGEYYFGAGKGILNFLYIESSELGIGGSIFTNGQLIQGRTGFAGEIGHMVIVNRHGKMCRCGRRGCWQTEIAPIFVLEQAQYAMSRHPETQLHTLCAGQPENLTLDMLAAAYEQGDMVTENILRDFTAAMSIGIANLVNIFDPDKVIIGGVLRTIASLVIQQIEQQVNQAAMSGSDEVVPIEVSPLDNSCTQGAIAMVTQPIIADPLQLVHTEA